MKSTRRQVVVRFALALAFAAGSLGPATAQQGDRFYVMGVVRSPGVYAYTANLTVGGAIDRAGGYSQPSSAIEIVRVVDGEKQIVVATLNDAVLPNDTVNAKR
jgi:protein involved in polysaccharide export with SLBB domain